MTVQYGLRAAIFVTPAAFLQRFARSCYTWVGGSGFCWQCCNLSLAACLGIRTDAWHGMYAPRFGAALCSAPASELVSTGAFRAALISTSSASGDPIGLCSVVGCPLVLWRGGIGGEFDRGATTTTITVADQTGLHVVRSTLFC